MVHLTQFPFTVTKIQSCHSKLNLKNKCNLGHVLGLYLLPHLLKSVLVVFLEYYVYLHTSLEELLHSIKKSPKMLISAFDPLLYHYVITFLHKLFIVLYFIFLAYCTVQSSRCRYIAAFCYFYSCNYIHSTLLPYLTEEKKGKKQADTTKYDWV